MTAHCVVSPLVAVGRSGGRVDLCLNRPAQFNALSDVMGAIIALPVPVIARVQGVATAAGCQLVASCDLAVAADTARFAVSGVNVGLFCSPPAAALSRNVPTKRAFEMLIASRFIDAATAETWGLINKASPAEELDATVDQFVEMVLAKSPAAIRYGKALLHSQPQRTRAGAHALAGDVMARNMMEEDAGEGVNAYFEKRPAVWKS